MTGEMEPETGIDFASDVNAYALSRRNFLRGSAASFAVMGIGGSMFLEGLSAEQDQHAENNHSIEQLLGEDPELSEAVHALDQEEHHEEIHGPELVDWVGAANFFTGVRALLPGGKGHIDSTRYASLGALLAIKYEQSDEVGKEHLNEEFKSVAMSGTIIEGTILASEALKLDFAEAYSKIVNNGEIKQRDAIPLLTMFSSVASPVVTTVGSAGILSKQAQALAGELSAVGGEAIESGVDSIAHDQEAKDRAYQILTAHVSNLSGFILFGDPPFIAMAEKYGLKPTLEYQLQAVWPLALQSLYAANQKLQSMRLEGEGFSGAELAIRSRKEAVGGLARNAEVLAKMCASSFANFAKVFALQGKSQNESGIQFDFSGMISDKIHGSIQLLMAEHIEGHEVHEATGSRTFDIDPMERAEASMLALKMLDEVPESDEGRVEHAQEARRLIDRLAHVIDENDDDSLRELLSEHGMSVDETEDEINRIDALRKLQESLEFGRMDEKDVEHQGWLGRVALAPKRLFRRATDLDRVKNALGHASADVLNVFPFQALSVPFLIPIFQKGIEKATESLESRIDDDQSLAGFDGEQLRGLAVANAVSAMVVVKSAVADNYVAAKIGLELMPDQPSYPLIAAITGGRLTAIGNMANPTLVPLAEYGMGDSIKNAPKNLPSVLLNLAWANVLDLNKGKAILPVPPEAKN